MTVHHMPSFESTGRTSLGVHSAECVARGRGDVSFNFDDLSFSDHVCDYVPRAASRSRFVVLRGLRYHIREWGPPDGPPLLLLHGARDTAASFQFVVDSLRRSWRVIAPDWRGHGHTDRAPGSYWLSDFLCDLDAIFDALFLGERVPVVGHSMGGNIAGVYAGLRPDRLSHLIILDALGNPLDRSPVAMPQLLLDLLEDEAKPRSARTFPSAAEVIARLMLSNRRLDAGRAAFLALANTRALDDGGFEWAWDPKIQKSWPTLHTSEEWASCWRLIVAPVLCLLSSDPRPNAATADDDAVRRRATAFHDITIHRVPDTGHNMHHDAPEFIASEIERFVRAT